MTLYVFLLEIVQLKLQFTWSHKYIPENGFCRVRTFLNLSLAQCQYLYLVNVMITWIHGQWRQSMGECECHNTLHRCQPSIHSTNITHRSGIPIFLLKSKVLLVYIIWTSNSKAFFISQIHDIIYDCWFNGPSPVR